MTTIIVKADDGSVVFHERLNVATLDAEDRGESEQLLETLARGIEEARLQPPLRPRMRRIVPFESAVGRTFD